MLKHLLQALAVFRCAHIILAAIQHYLGHLGSGKFSIPEIPEDLFPVPSHMDLGQLH